MSLLLGLRLAVAGGRESLLRLAFTAIGVALGLTLLLLALTAPSAVQGRADRVGWQDAAYAPISPQVPLPVEAPDSALFMAVSDFHNQTPVTRMYVAALGANPPVPPGLDRLPGPGEVAASPAMRRLLESTPDDQLDDRFPGQVTLTIGREALAHENELVAIIGRTPDQLRDVPSVQEIRGFDTRPLTGSYTLIQYLKGTLVFFAMLLLVPILVLVVMVTRAAATQREQRLAAVRLVGATRGQTAVLAAAETGVGAVAGAALAWVAYEVGRRVVAATVTFQGGRFYLEDLTVPSWVLVGVLGGAPLLAMLTTIASLRRVYFGPLGVSRGRRRSAPSAWSALPLAIGIGGPLVLLPLRGIVNEQVLGSVSGMFGLLQIVGFVLIGPWLCMLAGRGVARLSRRATGLIAARRIAADPHATFRAVSGVVLAAWVVTQIGSTVGPGQPLVDTQRVRPKPGVVWIHTSGVPDERAAPILTAQAVVARHSTDGPVVSCAELSRVRYVPCPHSEDTREREPGPGPDTRPIEDIYIPTDGTPATENRLRTRAANLMPNAQISTDDDPVDWGFTFPDLGSLASVACLFVLLVSAFSLTAGMIGRLVERRRPFALLRASGMRLGELRQIVFLETAATMVVTSALGVGLGLVTAYLAVRQGSQTWQWPDLEVFAYLGSGVLAAMIFSTFALPLIGATTRHDAVRYE